MYDDLFGHDLEWQRHSRCRRMGTELFFPQDGESPHQRSKRERAAKQLCACCPVADRCRTHAVDNSEPHGIRGGLSAHERRSSRQAADSHASAAVPAARAPTKTRTETIQPRPQ
ncbi:MULTISPECIES: WhiB family transcriptional regulator [unclassified Rhodococcus (in: high G+C Gram-positive bacteria)]|uniref:WhiB family transcriptional regulator n=1 Tax=unclassified Rhodococcus (in: high G+C Gram-positive bacteria) TaxID=192944 RepID=UPI00163AB3E1|nr:MULTISPECIES: WhiB family transcriptional regulator [unclassified Rhodococcus (in: high G+C Gram-positive bacteria)]MBC2637881.1 WhiB family transcriptional regulator [Rhodococcus sp. 3A]MBC2897371.1 WhiB family transcriptional regulator [Rhodococcus sp. 4CII]